MKKIAAAGRRNEQARGLGQMGKTSPHVSCAFSGRAGKARSDRNKPGKTERDHHRFYA